MPPPKHKRTSHHTHRTHRTTLSLQKTEIIINVYDLLAPGHWSNLLWHMGTSLLHSGVVINGKEYAYGGHDRRGVTGVYWTAPRTEPPGGTFRCELLHGFTLATPDEIDAIMRAASREFLGPAYNLLTKNCNHFTAFLCRRLTGRPGPAWLNRAASIGVALPCVVPRAWVGTPALESSEGDLLLRDEDRDDDTYAYGDEESGGAFARDSSTFGRNSADGDEHYNGDDARDVHEAYDALPYHRPSVPQIHLIGLDDVPPSTEHALVSMDEGDEDDDERHASKGKGRAGIARDYAGHALPPSERIPNM